MSVEKVFGFAIAVFFVFLNFFLFLPDFVRDPHHGALVFSIMLSPIVLIPAFIASNKGRSFVGWALYSSLLWVVALVHSLAIKENDVAKARSHDFKQCPYCGEFIKRQAIKCKFCQTDLPTEE